jgi:outer membrane protein OmpA-like peptidoglycan-associated protein/tetratricopeptide (TPR) repeat protein
MQSQSQKLKSQVQIADQYFAAGEYYTAANLYEQFLNPPKKQKKVSNFPLNSIGKRRGAAVKVSATDVLLKQAESYRLANYWQKAAESYKGCFKKNPVQYADALYWYGVCERSLGNYANSKESIQQYLATAGKNSQYREAAEKELQTLLYIQQQLARPDSVLIRTSKLNAPNSTEKGLFAPIHVKGNQFLVSSSQKDSAVIEGVNPYHSRLFYASLNNGNLVEMKPVALPVTNSMSHQGAACISADGKYLYFTQWKKERGRTTSSIYFAAKENDGWGLPTLLPLVNRNGNNSKQPFCSSDGKYLFFASDRRDGIGNFDIWYAPLNDDGTTGEPVNAGTVINTTGDEQAPFYHKSSLTLVFSSNARQGMGGYDLFASKGNELNWNTPENLGHPVNSTRDDIYFFAPEKAALLSNAIFSSDRGEGCCLETYSITKDPKSKILTGILRDCNDNMPIAEAEINLKDASQKSWTVRTDIDGKYQFDLGNGLYKDLTLTIKRELYKVLVSPLTISSTDETDLLIDKLTLADLCVEKIPALKPEEPIIIKAEDVVTLYFDFDKSKLKPDAMAILDSIYNVMVEYPATTIQISGYTDGLGTEVYNKKLSDKRAKSCSDYLVKKGIDGTRIRFVSFGACCPVEMEIINGRDNADGRSRNRRALINIKKD